MRASISAYVKLLRLPGLGGLAIPPVFGAISIGMFNLSDLLLLFVIGSMAAIFGFVLNDYADVELDALIPELRQKPLVDPAGLRKVVAVARGHRLKCTHVRVFRGKNRPPHHNAYQVSS